jgi:hypothetical protein
VAFFTWLESTAASVWIRESPSLWGFPFILYLHTLGLALIAGLSSAVALAILFLPERLPRAPLAGLFPLMWVGLAINAASGLALLIAYPAKALTNPVFFIKLVAIAGGVGIVAWLERRWRTGPIGARQADASGEHAASAPDLRHAASAPGLQRAAWTLLGLWVVATLTGRLLAYTHSVLLASMGDFF